MAEIKFISWSEFGDVVTVNQNEVAIFTVKEYAKMKGFDVKNRLGSAVKELLALAKLYDFDYTKTSRGFLFPISILDAAFTTVIVSAAERDIILRGMSEFATHIEKEAAYEIVESLMIDPPKHLFE